jgi:hypothetical protein
MAASVVTPVNRNPTSTLSKGFGPVPDGEEWSVDVRACIDGAASDTLDLVLRTTGGTNVGERMKDHAIAKGSGTQDVEKSLIIPAGYELWDRAPLGNVSLSYTATKRAIA